MAYVLNAFVLWLFAVVGAIGVAYWLRLSSQDALLLIITVALVAIVGAFIPALRLAQIVGSEFFTDARVFVGEVASEGSGVCNKVVACGGGIFCPRCVRCAGLSRVSLASFPCLDQERGDADIGSTHPHFAPGHSIADAAQGCHHSAPAVGAATYAAPASV